LVKYARAGSEVVLGHRFVYGLAKVLRCQPPFASVEF